MSPEAEITRLRSIIATRRDAQKRLIEKLTRERDEWKGRAMAVSGGLDKLAWLVQDEAREDTE